MSYNVTVKFSGLTGGITTDRKRAWGSIVLYSNGNFQRVQFLKFLFFYQK